ncbi:MAG TPA: FG-GAP repeat protein [Terriglobales bacterium]
MKTMIARFAVVSMMLLISGAYVYGGTGTGTQTELPLSAQSTISADVGREQPAYHLRVVGDRLLAENREQKFCASFGSSGVKLQSDNYSWRMALKSFGRGETLIDAGGVSPSSQLNRVEYRRGAVTEWYINGPLGLEQGFTVGQRVQKTKSGPLTLVFSLGGDLNATLDAEKTGLLLSDNLGHAQLQYGGLFARDADGRNLHAELNLHNHQLFLRVDDDGARYPIAIDPIVQFAKLTTSGGKANDVVGYSVAISGNGKTVAVGAPGFSGGTDQGAVYVFEKPSSGWANMTQTAKLTVAHGVASTQLGYSVAISGSIIVAGAPDSNLGPGAAYIFVEPATGWKSKTQSAELTASDGQSHDGFGTSVAINGDTVVVGSPYATIGSNDEQGAAYVFVKSDGTWSQTAKFSSSTGDAYDTFGWSVGTTGETIIAGAPTVKIGSNGGQGAAYIFTLSDNEWSQQAELTASNGFGGAHLGSSVAISGNTAVAGTDLYPFPQRQGGAYVFVEPEKGWSSANETAELTANDPTNGDELGFSVSISGSEVLVGAPLSSTGSIKSQGAAYVFKKPASGWATTSKYAAKLKAADGAKNDQFGFATAIGGTTYAIGAIGATISNHAGQGAAYVFGQQ